LEAEAPGPEQRAGVLFVAGFAHPPNVDAAKWLVDQIMPIVRARIPGVHLWLAGSNPTDEVKALTSSDVTVTGYVPDDELGSLYRSCRVAVVPLRFGAGVKHKVLEAMHLGVPLVTTSVGAQGLCGLHEAAAVADDAHAVADAIVSLLTDDVSWLASSRAGSTYVTVRYSSDAMMKVLREGMG
jgi:glycosyltransferase involved in cell wall biosynthesis